MDAAMTTQSSIGRSESFSLGEWRSPIEPGRTGRDLQLLISAWRVQQRLEELSRRIEQIQASLVFTGEHHDTLRNERNET